MRKVCAALVVPTACRPKVNWPGLAAKTGRRAIPVPVSGTRCGVVVEVSSTTTAPWRIPEPVGVKVTFAVQVAPAATRVPAPQVLLGATVKSPVAVTVLTGIAIGLVLRRVTVPTGLVVPTSLPGNVRDVGVHIVVGVPPRPDTSRSISWPSALRVSNSKIRRRPVTVPSTVGVNDSVTVHVPGPTNPPDAAQVPRSGLNGGPCPMPAKPVTL